ncbi:hypothetical protein [Elizabethkingia bruuniana]|uniref:hypothetical protein n=1 Tax=Elizabethkingia bruuniana TaxID=1756149 RepID=UPI0018ECB31D|nr:MULTISPECIES: hypothetical protein [Elizabethkingia]
MNTKKEILKIINDLSSNNSERYIGIQSIDRRLLLINEENVLSNQYRSDIKELVMEKYLDVKGDNSYKITSKGLEYLKQHSEE